MKIYGSLHNRIMEASKQPTPQVGDGCTLTLYTDRDAATVVEVISPKKVVVQVDKAQRTDKNGMSEDQSYEYAQDPNGAKHIYTLRKSGKWKSSTGPDGIAFGFRNKYHDFSF